MADSAEQLSGVFENSAQDCGCCVCGADATGQNCVCQGQTLSFGEADNPVSLRPHNGMGQYRGW